MATLTDRLAYILTFDTTSGVKSLQKFGTAADKELSKADKKLEKLGANLLKFGAGATAFAGVAGVGLFKLASGASDARQNFQALEQVVGTLSAEEFKKWADEAAQSIGTTSSKAVEAATSFAQLGKLAGISGDELVPFSTNLVSLAADLAAFKNVNPEQTLQDIRSGFSGSVEVMRKYGIFLDEHSLKQAYFDLTGQKVTGTLTAQQRVLATNAELFRQGTDMIGQFDRESESLVGQTAILKAELGNLANEVGEGILPAFTWAATAAGKLAESLGNLTEEQKKMAGAFAVGTVAVVGALGVFSLMVGSAVKLALRFKQLKTAAVAVRYAFLGIGVSASVALAGVTALTLGLKWLDDKGRNQDIQEFADSLEALGNVDLTDNQAVADGFKRFLDAYANDETIDNITEAYRRLALEQPEVAAALAESTGGAVISASAAEELGAVLADTAGEARVLEMQEQDLADQTQAATDAAYLQLSGLKPLAERLEEAAAAADAAREATEAQAEAHKEVAEALYDQIEAQKLLSDETFDLEIAQQELKESIEGGAAALSEYEVGSADWLKEVNKQKELAESVAEGLQAVATITAEAAGGTLSAADSIDIWNGSMLDAATSADGPFRESLIRSIALMNGLTEKEVNEILFFAQGDVAEAERMMEELSKTRKTAIVAQVRDQASAQLDAIANMSRTALIKAMVADPGLFPNTGPGGNTQNIPPIVPPSSAPLPSGSDLTGIEDVVLHDGGPVTSTGQSGRKAGLRHDEVSAVLQTGEYVLSRDQVKSASDPKKGPMVDETAAALTVPSAAPALNVTFSGDIYGIPTDEFWDLAAAKLNQRLAGRA